MTLIRTDDYQAGTDVSEPTTAEKRARAWRADPTPEPSRAVIDLDAVRRRVHPDRAHAPRLKVGVFTVPKPCPKRLFELERRAAAHRFVDALDRQGWEMVWEARLEWGGLPLFVTPGQNPAIDVLTKEVRWDRREFRIHAYFRLRNPQPITHEILADRVSISG